MIDLRLTIRYKETREGFLRLARLSDYLGFTGLFYFEKCLIYFIALSVRSIDDI